MLSVPWPGRPPSWSGCKERGKTLPKAAIQIWALRNKQVSRFPLHTDLSLVLIVPAVLEPCTARCLCPRCAAAVPAAAAIVAHREEEEKEETMGERSVSGYL